MTSPSQVTIVGVDWKSHRREQVTLQAGEHLRKGKIVTELFPSETSTKDDAGDCFPPSIGYLLYTFLVNPFLTNSCGTHVGGMRKVELRMYETVLPQPQIADRRSVSANLNYPKSLVVKISCKDCASMTRRPKAVLSQVSKSRARRRSGRRKRNALRKDDGDGETRCFPQLAKCESKILSERVHSSSLTLESRERALVQPPVQPLAQPFDRAATAKRGRPIGARTAGTGTFDTDLSKAHRRDGAGGSVLLPEFNDLKRIRQN